MRDVAEAEAEPPCTGYGRTPPSWRVGAAVAPGGDGPVPAARPTADGPADGQRRYLPRSSRSRAV